eukprot:scaffold83843_cov33-Attheya_sp.AAC.1
MEVPWETPALADRRLIIWASRRLGPFRSPMPVAPAVPVPGPMQGGLPFYAAQPASTVKNYTAMEHDKITGACTLTAADYPVYVPSIFAEILAEGRTTERVQSVLQ